MAPVPDYPGSASDTTQLAEPADRPWTTGTTRAEQWHREYTADALVLSSTRPSPGWAGSPATRVDDARGAAWLVGEVFGSRSATEAALEILERRRARVGAADRLLGDLPGHWLFIGHDRTTSEWSIITNRFATMHAYVAADRAGAAASTCYRALAGATTSATGRSQGAERALDWEAITGYCTLGFFPADRTPHQGVSIIRPATEVTISGGVARNRRYWQWPSAAPVPATAHDRDRAIDELGATLAMVLDEHARRSPMAVPISGGLDSRTTLAFLRHQPSERARLFSYGYGNDSPETDIARQLGRAIGRPVDARPVPQYLPEGLAVVDLALDGMTDITQSRQAGIVNEIAGFASAVMAAHWGDVWFDAFGDPTAPQAPSAAGVGGLTEWALKGWRKRGSDWMVTNLCAPQIEEPPDELVRSFVESEAAAVQHLAANPQHPADGLDRARKALKTEQWSFRGTTAGLRAYQIGVFPRLPFYDTRVTDLLFGFPAEWMMGRRLQIDLIRRWAPELAKVPWEATGFSLRAERYRNNALLPVRAARMVRRRVRPTPRPLRNWEIQFSGKAGTDLLRQRLLGPSTPIADLIDRGPMADLLDRHHNLAPDPGTGYALSQLLTLAPTLAADR